MSRSEDRATTTLAKLESKQLVALLSHPNDWYVRKARRILADRRDPEVIGPLRSLIFETKDDQLALEALWALYVSAGIQEDFALKLLEHRNPDVRRWTVRLLGDENTVSPVVGRRLINLAENEKDVSVRSQLASTAKRLPAKDGLAIVQSLLHHKEDEQDPHMPLLLWWALERHAVAEMDMVMEIFGTEEAWRASSSPIVRETVERLMRRYAAEGCIAA